MGAGSRCPPCLLQQLRIGRLGDDRKSPLIEMDQISSDDRADSDAVTRSGVDLKWLHHAALDPDVPMS